MAAPLGPFGLVLTLSGVSLSSKTCGCRFMTLAVNWFLRIYFWLASLFIVIISTINLDRFSLTTATLNIFFLTSLIIMIMFARRRRRIRRLIQTISSSDHSLTFKKMSACGLAIAVLAFSLNLTSGVHSVSSSRDAWHTLFMTIVFVPVYLNNSIVNCTGYYVLVLRLVFEYEQRMLSTVNTRKISYKSLIQKLDQIMLVRQEFEQLFNEIPFVVIAALFALVPAAVVNFMGSSEVHFGSTSTRIASFAVADAANIFATMLIVNSVCAWKSQARSTVDHVKRRIREEFAEKLTTVCHSALMEAMSDHLEFNLTGWSLFAIDRSLLLSVLSSVITFSVLICQFFANIK